MLSPAPVIEVENAAEAAPLPAITLRVGELALLRVPTTARLREVTELCCGFMTPPGLSVRLLGKDWTELDEAQRRLLRARIGVVPSDGGWAPHLGVAESVLLPALAHRIAGAEELRERAALLCRRLGLPGLPLDRPRALREAELARAACARALLLRPALLILENPIQGEATQELRLPLLDLLAETTGMASLWLTTSRQLWRDPTIPATARYRLTGATTWPMASVAA
jgi:predicted ABC-type transport system involved in lysophospholipase L1 biosynthesis ATPase subunit